MNIKNNIPTDKGNDAYGRILLMIRTPLFPL